MLNNYFYASKINNVNNHQIIPIEKLNSSRTVHLVGPGDVSDGPRLFKQSGWLRRSRDVS
jgi:hypothetical protein